MSKNYFGKHIYVDKAAGVYTHHGLGIGNGQIIHYSGLANHSAEEGVVEITNLAEFTKGELPQVKEHSDMPFSDQETVQRALSRLGERQYDVLHNNCEHFVQWCMTGSHKSWQARRAKLLCSAGIGLRAIAKVRHPAVLVAGTAAGYAYLTIQGKAKRPDIEQLERNFQGTD